jgi:uncharacterized protein
VTTVAARFVGRSRELALLRKRLDRVSTTGEGVAVALRGRRQVGKSRLVQEFCDRSAVPYVFTAATKGASPAEAVQGFLDDLRTSGLGTDPDLLPAGAIGWPDAFRALASALPDTPAVVVLDELPWLAEQDTVFDGALQNAWDRTLARRPVLLLLLGSDLHMMGRLTAHDQPFYGRADTLVLDPLTVAETGDATGLAPVDAIDAHLVSGGLPGVLRTWPHGMPALPFLKQECDDPAAAVFGVPEGSLLAEFPAPDQARRVLEAVGSGERTHAAIAAAAGNGRTPVPSGTLSPLVRRLVADKRALAVDEPLSIRPGRPALYRVADTSLRLHLAMLREAQELSRRGRTGAAFELVQRRWTSWRGRAVEPLVRSALELACADGSLPFPDVGAVGGWWNRRFDPEVDIVGADRGPIARRIDFAGSVKWLATPFDRHDLAALARSAGAVPGYEAGRTASVVVSMSGAVAGLGPGAVDVLWTADDVVAAWR